MKKDISCGCKCKFNSAIHNSNQEWNNKTFPCECKNYCKCRKILAHVFFIKISI